MRAVILSSCLSLRFFSPPVALLFSLSHSSLVAQSSLGVGVETQLSQETTLSIFPSRTHELTEILLATTLAHFRRSSHSPYSSPVTLLKRFLSVCLSANLISSRAYALALSFVCFFLFKSSVCVLVEKRQGMNESFKIMCLSLAHSDSLNG